MNPQSVQHPVIRTFPNSKMTSFLTSSLGSLKTSTRACRPAGHSRMHASNESAEDFCSACSTWSASTLCAEVDGAAMTGVGSMYGSGRLAAALPLSWKLR